MNDEKNTPVVGDIEVDTTVEWEDDETDDLEALFVPKKRAVRREKRRAFWERVRKVCPIVLIWTRYLFPVAAALALVVMGFFKTVRFAYRSPISLWRLIWNTLVSARDYLGGEMQEAKNWFFGVLSVTALAEILLTAAAALLLARVPRIVEKVS